MYEAQLIADVFNLIKTQPSIFYTENYRIFHYKAQIDPFFDLLGSDHIIKIYKSKPKVFLFFKSYKLIGSLTLQKGLKVNLKSVSIEILEEIVDFLKMKSKLHYKYPKHIVKRFMEFNDHKFHNSEIEKQLGRDYQMYLGLNSDPTTELFDYLKTMQFIAELGKRNHV